MNRRTIIRIVIAAVLLHIGAFLFIGRLDPRPKTRYEPPPNFAFQQITYVDPKTGETTVEQRIRVSTRLAPPGTYEAYKPVELDGTNGTNGTNEAHEPATEPAPPCSPPPQ